MLFVLKALLSGVVVAIVSEVAKRSPALGALIVSLPWCRSFRSSGFGRNRRRCPRRRPRGCDLLVCPSLAANVPVVSGPDPQWPGFLDRHIIIGSRHRYALCRYELVARPFRRRSLKAPHPNFGRIEATPGAVGRLLSGQTAVDTNIAARPQPLVAQALARYTAAPDQQRPDPRQ